MSSLIRNQKTTGLKDENTKNLALVKLSKKARKRLSWIFTRPPCSTLCILRWGPIGVAHKCWFTFTFLKKKITSTIRLTSTPPDFLLSGLTSPHPPCWLAGWSRSGGPPPYEKRKLSLSNQFVPLVHALGVDLAPAVQAGQLTVIDYPVLLF